MTERFPVAAARLALAFTGRRIVGTGQVDATAYAQARHDAAPDDSGPRAIAMATLAFALLEVGLVNDPDGAALSPRGLEERVRAQGFDDARDAEVLPGNHASSWRPGRREGETTW